MAAQTRVDDDSPLIDSLKRIAVRIPSASWWIFFDPTSTSSQQHIWLRVPDSVCPITRIADVLTNREPKLQQDSCIIGQLNVLHWGTSCLIADEQITPSNSDQIICVEIVTTQKDGDRLVFWTDIRRPELLCLMGSRVSRIGVNGPTRLTPGTVIGGWISGCQYDSAQEVEERGLTLRQEAFLIPVDFQDSLKLYVVLLPSEETNGSTESPQEYNLMNGCSSPVSSIQTSAASFTRIRVLVENRMGCGDGVQMVGEHSIQTSGELADISASYELSDLTVISPETNEVTRRSFPVEETGYDSETDVVEFGEEAQSVRHSDLNGNLRELSGATTRDMQLSETLVEVEEFRKYVIACLTTPDDDETTAGVSAVSADLRPVRSSADRAMVQSKNLLRRMSLMKGQQSRINLQLAELSRSGSDEGSGDSGMSDEMNGWTNRNDASYSKNSNHLIHVIRKLFKLKKPVLILIDYFQMLTGLLELSNLTKELQEHSEMELSMLLHLSKQHLDDCLSSSLNVSEPLAIKEARSHLEILLRFQSAWKCVLRLYSEDTAASWRDTFSARLAELEKATVCASQALRLTARASMEAIIGTYSTGDGPEEPQEAVDIGQLLPGLMTLLDCYLEQTSELPILNVHSRTSVPTKQLIVDEVRCLESEQDFLLDAYAWISILLQMQPHSAVDSLSRLQDEALKRYADCLIFCQAVGRKSVLSACAETISGAKQRLESSSHLLTQPELLQLSDEVDHCETQLVVESMLLTKSTYKWQRVMQSWISGMTQEVDAVRQTIQKSLATLHAGQAQENQARLQERLKDMRSKTDSTASFETLISTWALVACYANLVDLDDLQETNEILAHLETTLMAKPASDHGADIVAAVEDGLQRLPDILRTAYGENESEHELLTSFSLSRSIARLEMERGRFAAPSMFLGFTTSFFRVMLQQHQQQQPNDCLESLLGLLEQKHAVCVEAVEAVGLCLKSLLGVKREFSKLRSLICKMGLQDADAIDAATQALCESAYFASDVLRQETVRIRSAVTQVTDDSTATLLSNLGSWMDTLKISVLNLRHQVDELASSRTRIATQLQALIRPVAELQWLSSASCLRAVADLCDGDPKRLQVVKANLAKRLATLLSQNSLMRRRDELNALESLERQAHEQYRDTVALIWGCAEPSADTANSLTPWLDVVCTLYDLAVAPCPEAATTPQAKAKALIERSPETEMKTPPTSNESKIAIKLTAPTFFNFLQNYNVDCVDMVTATAASEHDEKWICKQIELQEAVYRHEAVTSVAASLQYAPGRAVPASGSIVDQSAVESLGTNRLLLSVWPRVLERLLTCARDKHAAVMEARIARLSSAHGHLAEAMRGVIIFKAKLARFLVPSLESQAPGHLCLGRRQSGGQLQSPLQACPPTFSQLLQGSGLAEEISADFACLKKTMKLFEADCSAYMQLIGSPALDTMQGNSWIDHVNKISSMASLKFWQKNGQVVYQMCNRLIDHFDNYNQQVEPQVSSLDHIVSTLVRRELNFLKENLNAMSQKSALLQSSNVDQYMPVNECSKKVIQLETLLEFARETARILFTCLGASGQEGLLMPVPQCESQTDLQATPRVETPPPVAELARRAVDLKNSYEASEVGCQISEAWQCLQLLADQLGEIQAGLPVIEPPVKTNYFPVNAPWHPQCASDALLERRRDWTLLDLLGPHDCVFPGCRGEQAGACPHQNPPLPQDVFAETLLADLNAFYELLISEFRKRVLSVPDTVITSNSSVFSPSEESLRSLRADWHSDERLTGRWRSLRKRLSALFSLRGPANYGELLNRLESLQTLWGTSPAESADTSEDRLSGEQEQLFPTLSTSSSPVEPHIQPVTHSSPTSGDLTQLRPMNRLATVSSWVCELERQMNTEILPELQRGLVRGLDERIRPNPFFLSKVEACAEKMREVAVDRVIMAKSGLTLPASSYESIRKALRLGWLVVREYIMANCVEVPVIWSGLCGRHLHLLETYLSQTHSLDFDNKAIEKKKSELCQEYVTQNLATLAASGTEVSTWNECGRLYSTHGPLQSILLSRHLRNQRAPVAFTVFSLPDVSSVGYPRLPSEANETSEVFRLPGLKYGLIYLRSWMSMPELWSDSRDPVTPTVIKTVDLCHYTKSVEEGDGEEVIGFQPTVEVLTPRTDPLTTFSYSEGSSSVSLRTLDKPNSTQVITVADGEDVIDSGFLMDTEGMSSIDRGGREGRTHSFLTENSFSEVPDDLSLDENWEFRNYEQSTEIFQLSGQPIKIPHIPFRGLIRSPESHQSFSLCSSSLMESHHPQTMILQPSVSMQEDTTHSEPDLNTASLKSWPILAASRRFMTLGRCPKSLPELAVGCETRPIIDAVLRPLKLSATSENSSTHDTTIPADRPARSVASQDLTESTDEIEDQEREEDGGDGREDQTDETARREGRESSAGIANILALSKDDDKMEEEKEEEEEEEEEQTGLEDDVRTLMKLLRSMSPDEVVRELTGTSPWMPLNPKDSELQHNNIQPEHSRISHPITNTELTSRVSDDQAEVVSQARNELKTGVPTAMLRTPKTPEGGKVQDRDGELKKSGPAANGVETSSPHLEEPCKQPVSGTVFESEQRPQMTEPATMHEMVTTVTAEGVGEVGDLENLRVSTKSDSSCSPGIEIPSRIPDPSKLAKKKDTEGACWHPQHISKVDDEGKNCHLKADASDAAMEMLELSKLCSPPEELSNVSASIAAVRGDHLLPGDTQKIPAKEPVRTLKSSPVGEAERVRDLGSDSETEMPELSMFWSSPQEDAAEGPISGEEGESSGRAKEEVMGDAPEDRMEEAIGKGDVRSTIALQDEPRTELGEEERHDSRVSGKIPIERPAAEISNDAQETERNITSDESPTRDATTGPPIGWCTIMPRARLYKTTFSATPDRHDGTSQLYTVVDFPPHHEQPPLEAYAPLVCSAPDQSGSCHLSTEAGDPSDWTNREAAGVVKPAHEALPATAAVAGSAGNGVEYAHLPPAYKTDRTGDASFPMNGETVEDNEGVSVKRTEQSMDSRPVGLAGPLEGNLEGATAGPIKFPSQTVNSEGGELEQLFFQRASVGEVQSSDNESQRTTPVTEKVVGYQPPSCDAETEGPHDEPPMVVIEKALLPAIFQQDDWIREFYPPSDHPEPERKAVNELQRETVAKVGSSWEKPEDEETAKCNSADAEELTKSPEAPELHADPIQSIAPSTGSERTHDHWLSASEVGEACCASAEMSDYDEHMPESEEAASRPLSIEINVSSGVPTPCQPTINAAFVLSSTPSPHLVRLVEALLTHSRLKRIQGQNPVLEWKSVGEADQEQKTPVIDEMDTFALEPKAHGRQSMPNSVPAQNSCTNAKRGTRKTKTGKDYEACEDEVQLKEAPKWSTLEKDAADSPGILFSMATADMLVEEVENEAVTKDDESSDLSASGLLASEEEKEVVEEKAANVKSFPSSPKPEREIILGVFPPTAPSDRNVGEEETVGKDESEVTEATADAISKPITAYSVSHSSSEEAVFTMTPKEQEHEESGNWGEQTFSDDELTLGQVAGDGDSEVAGELTVYTLKPAGAQFSNHSLSTTQEDTSTVDEDAQKLVLNGLKTEQHYEQHSCPNGSDDIKGLWRTTPTEFVPSVVQSSLANQTEERSQPAESNQVGSSVGSDEDTIGGAETLVGTCKQEALSPRWRRNRHKKPKPSPQGKSAEVPSITKFKDADEEEKGAVFDADDFPTLPTEIFSMFDSANYGGLSPVVLPPLHSALITQSVAANPSAVEKERAIIEVFKPLNQVAPTTPEDAQEVADLGNFRACAEYECSCRPGFEIVNQIPDQSKLAYGQETAGSHLHPKGVAEEEEDKETGHLESDIDMEMPELSNFWSPTEELSDEPTTIGAIRDNDLLPGDTKKTPAQDPGRTLKSSPVGEAERARDLESDSESEMPELSTFWSSPQEDAAEGTISGEEGESSGNAKERVMGDAPEDRTEEAIDKGDDGSISALQDEPRTELVEEEQHNSRVSGKILIERPAAETSNYAQETERNVTPKKSRGLKLKKRPDPAEINGRDQGKTTEAALTVVANEAIDSPRISEIPRQSGILALEDTSVADGFELSGREKARDDGSVENRRPTALPATLNGESGVAVDPEQQPSSHEELPGSESPNESAQEVVEPKHVGASAGSQSSSSPGFEIITRGPELHNVAEQEDTSGRLLHSMDAVVVDARTDSDTDTEMPELATFWFSPSDDHVEEAVAVGSVKEAAIEEAGGNVRLVSAGDCTAVTELGLDSRTEVLEPPQFGSSLQEDASEASIKVVAGNSGVNADENVFIDAPEESKVDNGKDLQFQAELSEEGEVGAPIAVEKQVERPAAAKDTDGNTKTKKTRGRNSKKRPGVQEISGRDRGKSTEASLTAEANETVERPRTSGGSRQSTSSGLKDTSATDIGLPGNFSKGSRSRKNRIAGRTNSPITKASKVESEHAVRRARPEASPVPNGVPEASEPAVPDSPSEALMKKETDKTFEADKKGASSASSASSSPVFILDEFEKEEDGDEGGERPRETRSIPSASPKSTRFGFFGWRLPFSRSAQTSISLDPDAALNVQVESTGRSPFVGTLPEQPLEQRQSPPVLTQIPSQGSLLDDVVEFLSDYPPPPPPPTQQGTISFSVPITASPAGFEIQSRVRRRREGDEPSPSSTVFGIEEIPSFSVSPQLSSVSEAAAAMASSVSTHDPQDFELLGESEYSSAAHPIERLPTSWVQVGSEDVQLEDPELSVDINPTKEREVAVAPAASVPGSGVQRKRRWCALCLCLLLLLIPLLLLLCLLFPLLCPFLPPGPCPILMLRQRLNSFLSRPLQPPI